MTKEEVGGCSRTVRSDMYEKGVNDSMTSDVIETSDPLWPYSLEYGNRMMVMAISDKRCHA